MTEVLVVDIDGFCKIEKASTDFRALQELVHGPLESFGATRDWVAYGNEEGRLMGLLPNPVASKMLAGLGSRVGEVVGPVIFLGLHVVDPEEGPEETDVPDVVLRQAAAHGYP